MLRGNAGIKEFCMLKGERIILRPVNEADLDSLFELTRQYPDMGSHFSFSLLSQLVEKNYFEPQDPSPETPEGSLMITDLSGGLLGSIAYFKGLRYARGYELAFHIFRTRHRGKGYMTEALHLLVDYLFGVKKTPRLQLNFEKENGATQKVAEKCGFTYEGTMRQAVLTGEDERGDVQDLVLYSLLRREWKERSKRAKGNG